MLGRYILHPDELFVEEIVEGEVTLAGMAALVESVLADPAFNPEFNGLIDLTRAHVNLRFDEVAELARGLKNDIRASRGHWAFVVSSTLSHGIVRMFEALSDDTITVELFRDRPTAETWLKKVAQTQLNQNA